MGSVGEPRGLGGTPPAQNARRCRVARVTRIPWFSTFFRFFFWSRFWSLPGGFQASFGTFFASMFSSKIFLISYLFLRPIFNWFLLIFGRIFQSKLCRVCLTFATWSNFKNLDFAWKILQKWRYGTFLRCPKCVRKILAKIITFLMVFGSPLAHIWASKIIQKWIPNPLEIS